MNILLTSLTIPEALPMLQPPMSLDLACTPPNIQLPTTQWVQTQPPPAPPHPGVPADLIAFWILVILAGVSRLIPLIYKAKDE